MRESNRKTTKEPKTVFTNLNDSDEHFKVGMGGGERISVIVRMKGEGKGLR
jgi:hypothetical protein